jgi:Ca-activated chloride channel family protein
LTDGASNTGPPPLSAAQQAAERRVRIYTIGFGTTQNAIMDCWSNFDDEPFGSPGSEPQPGGNFGSEPDEATLKQIAAMTGGKFYSATSATELLLVFQDLRKYVAATNKMIEVSVFFAAIAAVLSLAALILSLLWHPLL